MKSLSITLIAIVIPYTLASRTLENPPEPIHFIIYTDLNEIDSSTLTMCTLIFNLEVVISATNLFGSVRK